MPIYSIIPFAIDPMIPWFEILIFVPWNWPSWNGTCHARPVKDTRSSPLATSLTPRRPPWPFADWGDWGETCGSEAAPDVLCGLDSARTSNITGMYWGPMATTSGWSAGQPSMAKPSNHRGVQIWRQPQLRILVFNPPIEKVVLIEEDQLGKLANKSPRPGFLARSPLYLMVFTTLKIAMYSNV